MIESILYSWLGITIFVSLIWLGYIRSKNPSIIDAYWSIGILISASIFSFIQNQFSIYWFCLLAWACRLSSFLWYTRIRNKQIDQRYLELSKSWKIKKSLGFLVQYQFQGILMLIISLPFLFIANQYSNVTIVDYILICFVLLLILFESIADYQLYQFRRQHPGKVCDVGFWKYSRHPNYFFEWLIWITFAVAAINSTISLISIISPTVLLYIFVFITGPITEKGSLLSKGEKYLSYQKQTSMIIPWFKR